jgi:hypothetical protein
MCEQEPSDSIVTVFSLLKNEKQTAASVEASIEERPVERIAAYLCE